MISVALKAHGPNLGVGGGPGAVAEGLLTGLTLMLEPSTPGVWLAMTEWNPEPDVTNPSAVPAICHAVAVALMPADEDGMGLQLRFVAAANGDGGEPATVTDLARFLEGETTAEGSGKWCCPVKSGGAVELTVGAGSPASRLQRTGEPI
jgi:hypothetical protein